jgi:hypothetical protein
MCEDMLLSIGQLDEYLRDILFFYFLVIAAISGLVLSKESIQNKLLSIDESL